MKVLIFAALLIASPALAEETSPPIYLSGGMICDTVEQVAYFVENVKEVTRDGQWNEGCGQLQWQALGTVTKLPPIETATRRFQLVRYDFQNPELGTQYGIWGKPEPLNKGRPA